MTHDIYKRKPRATGHNSFEAEARAKKVRALTERIDAAARKIPEATPVAMLEFVERVLTPEAWKGIAIQADVNPPSAETIAAVIDVYRTRVGLIKRLDEIIT